jgi:hypothetical protein
MLKYRQINFGFMNVILLNSGHRRFGHSCGRLQGGKNKKTNTTAVCLKHSTDENRVIKKKKLHFSGEQTASVFRFEGSSLLARKLQGVTQNNTQCHHYHRYPTPCRLLKTFTNCNGPTLLGRLNKGVTVGRDV